MAKSDDKALQAANYILVNVILQMVDEDGLALEDVAERYFGAELRVENDRVIITPEGDPDTRDVEAMSVLRKRQCRRKTVARRISKRGRCGARRPRPRRSPQLLLFLGDKREAR